MKAPSPPAHLSKRAASIWTSVAREYELDAVDLAILLRACEALDRRRGPSDPRP